MKAQLFLIYIFSLVASASFAQSIENDDMYFNSKDRAKLKAEKSTDVTYASAKKTKNKERENENEEVANPTDSYSARNVNPEFAARSNAEMAQEDNEDYFVDNYQYKNARDLNTWNNNFNNWYNNSWYRPNYFGPSIYSWNSPYYGYYDPYYSPWYDPYWNYSGWSTSFSYYWGNTWSYGWGGNYNYWNRPYCGYASSWGWGPSFGWGSGWYGNRYPQTIVVVNNYGENGRNVSYGKRPSRSTVMVNEQNNSRTRSEYVNNGNGRSSSGGRVANTSRQEEYYNRSWRYSSQNANNNDDGYGNTNVRSRYSNSNSGYNNDSYNNYRSNNSSFNNNNSFNSGRSSSGSGGGATRTSSSTGSGTNGRTRGN